MSRSGWTRRDLWNFLLTISFKYKHFHNSIDWPGLHFQVYIPSSLPKRPILYTAFRLLENAFVKLRHPWHDLIINTPCRTTPPQKICPLSAMKIFYKKVPPCFWGKRYVFSPLVNNVAIYPLSIIARKCSIKLVKILNLAERTEWQNRSIAWGKT